MDPLVRVAIRVQRALYRASGVALSVGFGGYLVWRTAAPPARCWDLLALGALAASTGLRLFRRFSSLRTSGTRRLDLELFTHFVVGAYALVLLLPGALDGPFYGVLYALMMLVAAFADPTVAIATLCFAVGLETLLEHFAFGQNDYEHITTHAALLGLFTFLNMAVFRAEIARVRRLLRVRIDSEIEKMREAARSYRLLAAPSSAADRTSVPPRDDEERLLRSGVDEIQHALKLALDLLRRSLGLRTAVLFGIDSTGARLHIQEVSSEEDAILPGPFAVRDGILGAAFASGEPVTVSGLKASARVPYYSVKPIVGSVIAVPALDHGQPRGVLVADRENSEPFSARERELVLAASHFMLRAIENERVFIQLERAKSEQGRLYRSVEALAAATTEAEVIEAGVSSAREFASFDFAVVTLFHRQSKEHEICAASGDGASELVGQRFRHNTGLVSMVVANRHALPYRGDYDAERQLVFTRRLNPPAMPSLVVLPLVVHERALGTLVLGSKRKGTFGDAVRPTLEVLASHIAVSLANARMLKRLEELATTDGLTGLFNKRMLLDTAEHKLRSATRFRKPLSVLVCDLDHFKQVNDTHGHDVGDAVIKSFAEVLKRSKRDTDVVGRFGGEEFVVVCEETDESGAAFLAERIRAELESAGLRTESGPLEITCSVGIATFPAAGHHWDTLFRSADEALYASKRAGRNRVTVWTPKLSGCAA